MTTVGFNPVLWARSTQCSISQSHDLSRDMRADRGEPSD
jgi:hypothetical protein